MALLQVKNLQKRFGDNQVLRSVSFELERGQVLAIIGSSGSGKTTLLRCMNFLETPESGEIWLADQCLLKGGQPQSEGQLRKNRLRFGLVFQNFNLFPQYTALENVTLAPRLMGAENKRQILCRGEELLRQVGLAEKRDFYPWQLSGGQQQRVAIARALAMQPDILCFDEPTSALDPELTQEVLRTIRDLKDRNNTMIVVTHEMGFAKSIADVVIYMADGRIEEIGTPEAIFENPQREKTRLFLGMQP